MSNRKRSESLEHVARGTCQRANGGQVVRLVAYVPPDLAKVARLRAVVDGSTVSALVADALGEHLGAA